MTQQHEQDIWDGFTVVLALDEDNEWLAHFIELESVSAFGETPESALAELKVAWEGVKESYQKHNESIGNKAVEHGSHESSF